MSSRYWDKDRGPWVLASALGVLVIALAVLFITISNIYQSVYHEHATSERRAAAQERFERECSKLPTVKEASKCFEVLIRSYGEAQRAQEDLYAQKQMAQWAFWMLIATFFVGIGTIGVATIGAYWVRETWKEAKRTGDAAIEAANAARTANDIAMGKERPILSVSVTKHNLDEVLSETVSPDEFGNVIDGFGLTYSIVNSGQSPALIVFNSLQVDLSRGPMGRRFAIDPTAINERSVTFEIVGPRATDERTITTDIDFAYRGQPLRDEVATQRLVRNAMQERAEFFSNRRLIWFSGMIAYRDLDNNLYQLPVSLFIDAHRRRFLPEEARTQEIHWPGPEDP